MHAREWASNWRDRWSIRCATIKWKFCRPISTAAIVCGHKSKPLIQPSPNPRSKRAWNSSACDFQTTEGVIGSAGVIVRPSLFVCSRATLFDQSGGWWNRRRNWSALGMASCRNCLGSRSHNPSYSRDFESEISTSIGSGINSADQPGHQRLAFAFVCASQRLQGEKPW